MSQKRWASIHPSAFSLQPSSSDRPMNIGHEMLVLGVDLIVKGLDHVADRDDADELRAGRDRDLGDMPVAHLAHHVGHIVVEVAGHRVASHHFAHPEPAEPLASVMDDPEHVAFAEDPVQVTAGVDDGEGTNVVLNEFRNGLADGRVAIDCDHAATLGFQDVSDQHGTLPYRQESSVANGSESPPTDALDLKIWK